MDRIWTNIGVAGTTLYVKLRLRGDKQRRLQRRSSKSERTGRPIQRPDFERPHLRTLGRMVRPPSSLAPHIIGPRQLTPPETYTQLFLTSALNKNLSRFSEGVLCLTPIRVLPR